MFISKKKEGLIMWKKNMIKNFENNNKILWKVLEWDIIKIIDFNFI